MLNTTKSFKVDLGYCGVSVGLINGTVISWKYSIVQALVAFSTSSLRLTTSFATSRLRSLKGSIKCIIGIGATMLIRLMETIFLIYRLVLIDEEVGKKLGWTIRLVQKLELILGDKY